MTQRLDKWERAARERWLRHDAKVHYGRCEACGRLLLVARQKHARRFLCLHCFEFGPDAGSREGEGETEGQPPALAVVGPPPDPVVPLEPDTTRVP